MSHATLEDLPIGSFLPIHVPVTTVGPPAAPLAGALRLGGWSFVESTGAAAAQFEIWDGGALGGETVAVVSLDIGKSCDRSMPGLGLLVRSNLSINVIAGSIRGSVWVARP